MDRAISKDATSIEYAVEGEGPTIVLVHGAMQTSRNFTKLSGALSKSLRVVRYDRRGRGRNRAGGIDADATRLAREQEDLAAVIEAVQARTVFGLSSGAILAMGATRDTASVDKVLLYEPPLTFGDVDPAAWTGAFLDALARNRIGTALSHALKGTSDRNAGAFVPRVVYAALAGALAWWDVRAPNGERLRDLVTAVPADIAIQREASRTFAPLSRFSKRTLLLGGDRSAPALTRSLDRVAAEIPNATRACISGSGHIAADDSGNPNEVARVIEAFVLAGS